MERSFIAWAKQRASKLPKVPLGIGDDCALLAPSSGHVVTCDSLCDGTHFILEQCGARAVGRKLAGVNLSDLASMAADPVALFLSLCLPRSNAANLATETFEGVCELAERHQVAIAGGDTNTWDGPLVVHMTAIGQAPSGGCWLRSGAKPGDLIVVSGTLGGSILGKHLDFEPRLALARTLREQFTIHGATDISDGLGVDLLNVFTQSQCGAVLDLDKIPISSAAHQLSEQTKRPAIEHALGDGEDFELLMAVPASEAKKLPAEVDGVPLTIIGEFTPRTGLWTRPNGRWTQLQPKGYTHS
jgi:thiamine-monophosphate kinase